MNTIQGNSPDFDTKAEQSDHAHGRLAGDMRAPAHVIVFGNEKGGSGKSTAAIHIAIGLMRMGYSVGTIDLDARQGTFTRHILNRAERVHRTAIDLPIPDHVPVERSEADMTEAARAEEINRLIPALDYFKAHKDFIVIDTPGYDSHLSRLGHSYADTLVTPINDSFIDLDLLARIDQDSHAILGPSVYSEMVWEQRKKRACRDGGSIDWIVMRNRLGHLDSHNKRDIAKVMTDLTKRIGLRFVPGFGERVIFRELFLKGLTLLDVVEEGRMGVAMSHIAARQEVRSLLSEILSRVRPRGTTAKTSVRNSFAV